MEKKILSVFFTTFLILIFSHSIYAQSRSALRIERHKIDKSKPANNITFEVLNDPKPVVISNQTDNQRAIIPIGSFFGASGNGRAPQGSRRFINTKALYSDSVMLASGFTGAVTSVSFNWQNGIAQSVATTGNLKIFLKDTVAGATTFSNSFIDTTGAGGVKVYDGTITIPAVTAGTAFEVNLPVGGPGTGTYTYTPGNGLILIFVYKTTTALATPSGSPTVACFVGPANSAATYQSQTAPGNIGSLTSFRPFIALGNALVDAISMGAIYSLGEIGVCPCPDTDVVEFSMDHLLNRVDTILVKTTLKNAIGGGVKWESIDTIVTDTVERLELSSLIPKQSDTKSLDSIIIEGVVLGTEDYTSNNRGTSIKKTTLNRWNHANPNGMLTGGMGFTVNVDMAVRFFASCEMPICAVDLAFFVGSAGANQPYLVKIFGVDDDTLKPGALMYVSSQQTTPPGPNGVFQRVTHYLPTPINVPYGHYFVGITQIRADTSIAYGYQFNSPIRSKTFFVTSPPGSSDWADFADEGINFVLDIAPKTYLSLNVGVWLEGNYNGLTMIPDTVTVIAHSQISPYMAYDTARAVVGSGGLGTFNFSKLNNDSCYYYEIRQRNHLATWSHSLCEKIDECGKQYDFRNSVSQAFGNNMLYIPPPNGDGAGGGFGIYGGDVNQDGTIDAGDLSQVENDAAKSESGYVQSDVNGDDYVDAADLSIVENNATTGVNAVTP